MKKLYVYKYSLKDWAKFLPNHKIKPIPETKTAAEMISQYQSLKISEMNWIEPINEKVHKNIETQLKYKPYTQKMSKVIIFLFRKSNNSKKQKGQVI